MKTTGLYICLWSAPIIGLIWLAGFLLFPGFNPPLSPTMSAEAVASFYADPDNIARARYSMILFNWFGIGLIPFYGLIVTQMKRMALYSDVWPMSFICVVSGGICLFACTDLFFQLAAFRPDRDPAITQAFNDMAWITFTVPVSFVIAQCLVLTLAIFMDRQPKPIYPRWVGVFNLFIAIAIAPSVFAANDLTGPFAWDGAYSYWGRMGLLCLWTLVMFFVAWADIKREKREAAALASADLIAGAAT